MAEKLKILFSNNSAWSVYNFRVKLLQKLKDELNADIYVLCPHDDKYSGLLEQQGFIVNSIDFNNNDTSIRTQLRLLKDYYVWYKKLAPDVILHNAIIPNIYGTIAGRLNNIPVINNISGMGSAYIKGGLTWRLIKRLLIFSQRFSSHIFFQNEDDQNYFRKEILSAKKEHSVLPGSGVDLDRFNVKNRRFQDSNKTKICFIGRLIKDKGINEFIEAAGHFKDDSSLEFHLVGELDEKQISGITEVQLNNWIDSGMVKYHAKTDELEKLIGAFDVIALPSYREGLARVLLESAATGIPIVTTNVPGCYQTVIKGKTGYLCEPKDAASLIEAMGKVINMTKAERIEMGNAGRKYIEKHFDERIVIDAYLSKIRTYGAV